MLFCLRGHKWWQNDEQYQNHYINQKDTHNNRLYINFGRKSANYVCSLIANSYKDSLFGQNNELNSCTINHLVELMSQFPENDISFVHASEELITVTTPCLCAVCVCMCWGECMSYFYEHLIQIVVSLSLLQIQRALLVRRETRQHLIEDVIVSLRFGLKMKTHTQSKHHMQKNIYIWTQS